MSAEVARKAPPPLSCRQGGDIIRSVPRVYQPIEESLARYLGTYGGRGSSKSHYWAERIIDKAQGYPGDHGGEGLRWICCREIQKSLKQSSMKLLTDKLNHFRLRERDGWKVYKESIQTPGGGLIDFLGLQDHTVDSIKSYEGAHGAWIEEAHTISETSLKILRPTVRTAGSQIYCSWNPRHKRDAIDKLLRGGGTQNCTVIHVNWTDNPWVPDVLEDERQSDFLNDPDDYPHTWEGDYQTVHKGAYFKNQMNDATKWQRIRQLVRDPYLTVHLFHDLGGTGRWSDAYTIWAIQFVGDQEVRCLDYYEVNSQEFTAHLAWLKNMDYGPDKDVAVWLPHDGETNEKMYDNNFAKGYKKAGYVNVTVIPNQGQGAARARIDAVRKMLPFCQFNNGPKPLLPGGVIIDPDDDRTKAGRDALGWYHERVDEERDIGLGPEHDWSSHGCDAFGLAAICRDKIMKKQRRQQRPPAKPAKRRVKDKLIGY